MEFKNKKISIAGFGKSGKSIAEILLKNGNEIFISDSGEESKFTELIKELDSTIKTMEQRLETFDKVSEDMKSIDLNLMRIEEQLELLKDLATVDVQNSKGSVSKQIDNAQQSIDENQEWMETAKDLFAPLDDDLTETPPDDVFVQGVSSGGIF